MARFIAVDRDTQFLFPPSVQEWLPEDHLARFIVDIVEQLDVSGLEQSYAGRGSDAHHPAMLLALLLYGYATGTSPAEPWNGPAMTRSHFATSRGTRTRITTRSTISASAS
jgi:hypothetical protein